MTRHAITGPVELDLAVAAELVVPTLEAALAGADEFTSGAAVGIDSVGVAVAEHAGVPIIRLTVPWAWHNADLVDHAKKVGWQVEYAKKGASASESYMLRNDLTISHADVLSAFPETSAELQRSGTWATIRRARKAGLEIRVTPLDGSSPWVESRASHPHHPRESTVL